MTTTAPAPADDDVIELADEVGAIEALTAVMLRVRGPERLYRSAGQIARVTADGHAPRLEVMDRDALALWLSRHAHTVDGRHNRKTVPTRLLRLVEKAAAPLLPNLARLVRFPIITPGGTFLADGYDEATGLYVSAPHDMRPVSDRPDRAEVTEARRLLSWLWSEFPFRGDSDRAAVWALYLTPMVRGMLSPAARVPLQLVTAAAPGSGKSWICEGLDDVYGGQLMLDAAQADRELQKTIVASVNAGHGGTSTLIDNWKTGGNVGSGGEFFTKLLSTGRVVGRVIGSGTHVDAEYTAITCVSGNRVGVSGDMARRTVIIRLDPDTDRPEEVEHSFEYRPWLAANRGEMLWALGTLAADWIAAGRPRAQDRRFQMGQFTEWAQVLGGLIAHHAPALGAAFLADRRTDLADMDREDADYRRFYRAWADTKGAGLGTWVRASRITNDPLLQDLVPREDGQEHREVNHRTLGAMLRGQLGRDRGGLTVERKYDSGRKSWMWRIVDRAAARAQRAAAQARPARTATAPIASTPQRTRTTRPPVTSTFTGSREPSTPETTNQTTPHTTGARHAPTRTARVAPDRN